MLAASFAFREENRMKTRIGILGYGNLGRGIESAIRQSEDLELVAVFTRRDPKTVKIHTEHVPVVALSEALDWKDKIDVMVLCGGSARNSLPFDAGSLKFSDELSADELDVNALLQDVTGGLGGRVTGRGQLSLKLNGSAAKGLSYAGTGQFTMGEGAVTGFSGLDIVTRLYGTQGVHYVSVKAPFTVKTGKLILHAGAEATAPKGDPLYRYAKLASDGVINFDKTLNVPIELMVNYQLVNALTGGGTGALGGLLEGGANVADTLKQALGGGLEGAQKGGARADFRTVTLTLKGRADAPSVKDLKIGASTLKDKSQSAAVTATMR